MVNHDALHALVTCFLNAEAYVGPKEYQWYRSKDLKIRSTREGSAKERHALTAGQATCGKRSLLENHQVLSVKMVSSTKPSSQSLSSNRRHHYEM